MVNQLQKIVDKEKMGVFIFQGIEDVICFLCGKKINDKIVVCVGITFSNSPTFFPVCKKCIEGTGGR